jgi:prophage DNA circulation protein
MSHGFRFEASFGGVRIDVISTSTSHPRRVFPHEFPKKNGATTEDQGRGPLVIDLQFVFIDRKPRPGEELPIEDYAGRFATFEELLLEDTVRTLVHPYLGQIRCRIGQYGTNGDGEGQPMIKASAQFTEENTEPAILDIVDGAIQATAGAQAVLQASFGADLALDSQGLSSELTGQAAELSAFWGFSIGLTTREVQLSMAELNGRLNTELEAFETSGEIDLVPVIQAYTLLQYRLRKAAESFTTTTPRVVEITTTALVPLRAIVAEFYGAAEADRRFLEVLELNPSLKTPACVPPSVTLKAYSRTVRPTEFRSS